MPPTGHLTDDSFPFWAYPPEECLDYFDVTAEGGLSDAGVAEARAKYGWNELEAPETKPLWKLVLEQFDDLLVKVRAWRGKPRVFDTRAPGR